MEGEGRVEAEWRNREVKLVRDAETDAHKVRCKRDSGDSCQLCDHEREKSRGKAAISPTLPGSAVIFSSLTGKTTSERPESTWHTLPVSPSPPTCSPDKKICAFIKEAQRKYEKGEIHGLK